MRSTRKHLQLQAIKFGVLSAIIGCAIFVLIEQTSLILKFGFDSEGDLEFAALVFVFGSMLASLPTVVSSSLLAMFLYNESVKHSLSRSKAVFIGGAFGVITGIGVSILGVILTNGRGSLPIYLLHAIEVTLIATLCGGWTGNELTKYIHTQKNSITLS